MSKIVNSSFYLGETKTVARELIGKILVRILPNGSRLTGRIVETEAYLGAKDPACHSFGLRKTKRIESMYLKGGHSYVYLIYGMYYCFNVVTREKNEPEAVLIRALEPLEGVNIMFRNRKVTREQDLCSGPGKLCQAMGIDRSFDGLLLKSSPLLIEGGDGSKFDLISSPRIGIPGKGVASSWKLRFHVKDSTFVTKK